MAKLELLPSYSITLNTLFVLVEGSELGDRSCEIRAEGSELWDRSCEVRGEGLGLGAMGSELWAEGS